VEQWYLNEWERMNDLYTFRFGYLKLAPIRPSDQVTAPTLLSGFVYMYPHDNYWRELFVPF
jgi:hypothetical protein